MSKGKTPGTSGFALDVYIVFWLRLKDHFMEMLQMVLAEGFLGRSALTGIIMLLPKSDRNLNMLKIGDQ